MLNNSEQAPIQFSWPAILWRLALTALLLAMLAGSSLTVFGNITTNPDTNVLPTLTTAGRR